MYPLFHPLEKYVKTIKRNTDFLTNLPSLKINIPLFVACINFRCKCYHKVIHSSTRNFLKFLGPVVRSNSTVYFSII